MCHNKGMRTNETTYLYGLRPLMVGVNARHVTERIGLNVTTLYALIACRRGASLAMALKLSRGLNTTIEALLGDQPQK